MLCNYGRYQLENGQPIFEPIIKAEGYTVTWSYYTKDSLFTCSTPKGLVLSNKESRLYPSEPFYCIDNIATKKRNSNKAFKPTICDLTTFRIEDEIYKDVGSLDATQIIGKSNVLATTSFVVQEQVVPIKSPVISISLKDSVLPHLVLTKIVYPRQTNPYHYYFFPDAEIWSWSDNQKVLTANCVSILTFFDFEKGSFKTYFDSKHGVYTACQWSFRLISAIDIPANELLEELERQIRVFLDYHKLPENNWCISGETTVIIRKYPNPSIQDFKLVQKNSKQQTRRAK